MCEINPKHTLIYKLEAFTSDPGMTKEEFTDQVMKLVLDMEMKLNLNYRFRFHIHEMENK